MEILVPVACLRRLRSFRAAMKRLRHVDVTMTLTSSGVDIRGHPGGLGAKSQNLSSVAPPGRKSWLLFSVRDMSGGLRNPCFTKFSVVNFL